MVGPRREASGDVHGIIEDARRRLRVEVSFDEDSVLIECYPLGAAGTLPAFAPPAPHAASMADITHTRSSAGRLLPLRPRFISASSRTGRGKITAPTCRNTTPAAPHAEEWAGHCSDFVMYNAPSGEKGCPGLTTASARSGAHRPRHLAKMKWRRGIPSGLSSRGRACSPRSSARRPGCRSGQRRGRWRHRSGCARGAIVPRARSYGPW